MNPPSPNAPRPRMRAPAVDPNRHLPTLDPKRNEPDRLLTEKSGANADGVGDGRGEMEAAGGGHTAEARPLAKRRTRSPEATPPPAPSVFPMEPSSTVAHQPSAERSVEERKAAQVAQIAIGMDQAAKKRPRGR